MGSHADFTVGACAEQRPHLQAFTGEHPPRAPRGLKVLFLNQFFHPDLSATAQIATDLAEDLVAHGIEVTAVAGRGGYLGGPRLPREEVHRGIRIHRVETTGLGKRTLAHRAADYASFYAAAAIELLRLPRHDVVLSMTTPPVIAAAALPLKRLRGSRLVCWLQDLYPQIAVAVGALRPRSLATQFIARMSQAVLAQADRVVVLGDAMRDRAIASGASPGVVRVIPNWSDDVRVRPVAHADNPLRQEYCGEARLVVMYSGNMGRGHDMQTLLGAARFLRRRSDIRFVFQGEGARKREVQEAGRQLPNVLVTPYRPCSELAQCLSAADVHLVSLAEGTAGLMEPSKVYGVMAAGRPAIFVGSPEAEVARTLLRERCGVVVCGGDPRAVAAEIIRLADHPETREQMGARARRALETRYSRRAAARAFVEVLASLEPRASSLRRGTVAA